MVSSTIRKGYKVTADVLYSCTYYVETQFEYAAKEAVEHGHVDPEKMDMATSPVITSVERID